MNFIIASTFVDSLARLATPAQTLVKQAAFELQLAPEHPSFQLHRLERAADKNFWSARVNLDLCIILYRDADHRVGRPSSIFGASTLRRRILALPGKGVARA
jgi:mRNA-degrading endonuclease RelE of RelBE toxin-antitoxin system